jgi:hypothetical protein
MPNKQWLVVLSTMNVFKQFRDQMFSQLPHCHLQQAPLNELALITQQG